MNKLIIGSIFLVASLSMADVDNFKTDLVCYKPKKHVVKKKVAQPQKEEKIVVINNNTVESCCCKKETEPKVIFRRVVVERTVREEPYKNAISLLAGRSSTGLTSAQTSPTTWQAKTKGEFDIGGMYQRDFGRIRLSIGATMNSSVYGGVGLTF